MSIEVERAKLARVWYEGGEAMIKAVSRAVDTGERLKAPVNPYDDKPKTVELKEGQ